MSAVTTSPFTSPEAWDVLVVAGQISPGLCQIKAAAREYEWDIKKGKGAQGATSTFVQQPPSQFNAVFTLWTDQHIQQWDAFVGLIAYDPIKLAGGKAVTAVEVSHPSLARIGVHSVVTKKIGELEHMGKGLYQSTVEFLEYWPPPKASAVSTPSTTTGDKGFIGPPEPTAQDQLQADIAAKTAQAQALYANLGK